ncbi:hypothetical protein Tco_0418916 [Tanacetum coccineum]
MSEVPMSEEPNVGRTQEPIVERVIVEDYVSFEEDFKQGIDNAYETQYDVQSSEDAGTDDDDEDDDFLVDEENEIVKPDVDVHSFEDVDVINLDGFNSDPGNDNETSNYRRRMLAELSKEMEGTGPTRPSGSSGPTTRSKKRKNTSTNDDTQACSALDAHDKWDLYHWSYVVELQSTNPNTTLKIQVERNTDPSLPTRVFQRIYVCLGALKLGFRACKRELSSIDGSFMKEPFSGQVLAAVGLDSNNGIYPLAYALV